jgi:hypothetical protein
MFVNQNFILLVLSICEWYNFGHKFLKYILIIILIDFRYETESVSKIEDLEHAKMKLQVSVTLIAIKPIQKTNVVWRTWFVVIICHYFWYI